MRPVEQACWVHIENNSERVVLVKKYKNADVFSEQRVVHPHERSLITQGHHSWTKPFQAKIYVLDEKMKSKLIFKLKVDNIYSVVVKDDQCTYKKLRPNQVDNQMVAYQRMEEIWDNSNYYETLRVSRKATQREIRLAYLKMAKTYHPDHNKNPNAALMFERVVEAYNTLSDEEVRRQYDTHLRTCPGILSKSYWRQVFCHWNRDKAIQVGISTMLSITGSVILLTSLLSAPTIVGLPAAMLTGAVGGGIFSAGIGGLSIALSRQAAIEDNKLYTRWLKYSFWYGVAGAAAGAVSAGVGGLVGPAVGGGVAAVAASGAVNGAISGVFFNACGGIASERWIGLLKKLRIDAIALELAVATLTGAATGAVFQSILMQTREAATVLGQAKFSVKSLTSLSGASWTGEKAPHTKRIFRSNSDPMLLATLTAAAATTELTEQAEEETKKELEEQYVPPEIEEFLKCEDDTVECINEAISLYEAVAHSNPLHFVQFFNNTRAARVRMRVEYMLWTEKTGDDAKTVRILPQSGEMLEIPMEARYIQISFDYSSGIAWHPIPHEGYFTFAYARPVTRRFFITGFGEKIHISQIRDEYEQPSAE